MKQKIFQSYLSSLPTGFDFNFRTLATLNLINFFLKFAQKKEKKKHTHRDTTLAEFTSYAELSLN